jgi:RNA polymerase sigma-70 factor (ECF subfamily)
MLRSPLAAEDVHLEAKKLHDCMEHLPAEQRQSIALAYYRGLSQTEIALSLNQPEGTVKSWIRRALIHLRECIGL